MFFNSNTQEKPFENLDYQKRIDAWILEALEWDDPEDLKDIRELDAIAQREQKTIYEIIYRIEQSSKFYQSE